MSAYGRKRTVKAVALTISIPPPTLFRSCRFGLSYSLLSVGWDPELEAQIARAGRERILGFHVSDWLVPTTDLLLDRGMMGDGVIDLPRIRSLVEKAGFDGYTEVEIMSARDWWQRDADDVVRTCLERMQSAV